MIGCAVNNGPLVVRETCEVGELPFLVTPLTLDLADTMELTWAIVTVWAVAYAVRLLVRLLFVTSNDIGRGNDGT